jgi:hypothetical protein
MAVFDASVMVSNYDNVAGVEVAEFTDESDEPVEQRHCKIEEFYFEKYSGDLVLTFSDRDTGRFFSVSIPIKPNKDWNDFADSLPRWE